MEIVTTIGPKTINPESLKSLVKAGATDMRINLSHSSTELLEEYCAVFAKAGINPSLDTQGAQLRVTEVSDNEFNKGETVIIYFERKPNNKADHIIKLNHRECVPQLSTGDIIRLDFAGLTLRIDEVIEEEYYILARVNSPGKCILNRAVDIVNKPIKLNHLTEFDKYAISKMAVIGCPRIYYSFANSEKDVKELRSMLPKDVKLVSKIETKRGVSNLLGIAKESDAILIDRGDLSREFSIATIPQVSDAVISACKKLGVEVYVATNILDTMMTNKLPSRAEISDIWNLLAKGTDGIVLAAEVAIGDNPVDSVCVVNHMYKLRQVYDNNLILSYDKSLTFDDDHMSLELKSWF